MASRETGMLSLDDVRTLIVRARVDEQRARKRAKQSIKARDYHGAIACLVDASASQSFVEALTCGVASDEKRNR